MTKELEEEIKKIIEKYNLNCSVEDFCSNNFGLFSSLKGEREFIWFTISWNGDFSDEFLWEFRDRLSWKALSLSKLRFLSDKFKLKYKLLGYIK